MKRFTIIVAGGSGQRFGAAVPKQFADLNGKPLLMQTLERFSSAGGEIIIVLPYGFINYWNELCKKNSFNMPFRITEGGKTRTESVKKGLTLINGPGVVAIHDGVRPLVSSLLIDKLFSAAEEKGNAVPTIDIPHSLRKIEGDLNFGVDRRDYRIIQTPQCFQIEKIKEAYNKFPEKEFTDDASVMEAAGEKIFLVEGEASNIKITGQQDLIIAEALIRSGNLSL